MADFFNDTFTDADGVLLLNHTSDAGNAQYTGHTWTKPANEGSDVVAIYGNQVDWRNTFWYVRFSSVNNPEQFDAHFKIQVRTTSVYGFQGVLYGWDEVANRAYLAGIRFTGISTFQYGIYVISITQATGAVSIVETVAESPAQTLSGYTVYNLKLEVRSGGFARILADANPAVAETERVSGTPASPIDTAGVFGVSGRYAYTSPGAGATMLELRAEQFGATAQPFNLGSLSLQTVGRSTLVTAGGLFGFGSALKYWRVPTNAHPAVGNLQVVVMSSDAGHPTVQAGAVTPDQNGALLLLCSDQGVTTGEKRLAAVHDNTSWDTTVTQMKGGIGIATVVEV